MTSNVMHTQLQCTNKMYVSYIINDLCNIAHTPQYLWLYRLKCIFCTCMYVCMVCARVCACVCVFMHVCMHVCTVYIRIEAQVFITLFPINDFDLVFK